MTPLPPNQDWTDRDRRFGYARVSTSDQRLDSQRDALCAAGCHKIFEDHGQSGAKTSRPGLDELLDVLSPGDTLIVFKLDRLGRSVLHLADLLVWFREAGVHFCSLSEGIDTASTCGKLIFHIIGAVAEFQRDLIVENTRAGLQSARARGAQLGRPYLLSPEQIEAAWKRLQSERVPVAEVARDLGVSRQTLTRGLQRLEAAM